MHALDVDGFTVHAPDGRALHVPALQLARGEVAALLGPSGCGKTTMLAALFGLLRRPGWRSTGRVRCDGVDVHAADAATRRRLRRERLAFLPQDAHGALDPLQPLLRQLEDATGATPAACVAALASLGVEPAAAVAARHPHAVSGGQAQRALLAIALLRAPRLVVADEPTNSLDGGSRAELIAQLRTLVANGSALLLATHDRELVHDLGAEPYPLRGDRFERGAPAAAAWPAADRAAAGTDVVLAARGLHVAFGARTVLDGVDVDVRRGEIVAIVGPSGAGKTTLLRVLAGRLAADRGTVTRPPARTAVQLVAQDAAASLTPGVALGDLLAQAHAPGFAPVAAAATLALPPAALGQPVARLAGGERRRAALLRALAVAPDVLLLDEPTASLDPASAQALVATLLARQRDRGVALVLVTHDEALARAVAHRVLTLTGGRLCTC